jgi:general stress protein YciG
MAGKSKRGFASMDRERQKEIASKGGRAAHAKGTAHEWSSDEARVAGRKGGVTVSRDRAHMAAIGREGGESRSGRGKRAQQNEGSDREMQLSVSREGGERAQPMKQGGMNRPMSSDQGMDADER